MKYDWIFFDIGATLFNEEMCQKDRFERLQDEISRACGRVVSFEEFEKALCTSAAAGIAHPGNHTLTKFGVTGDRHFPRRYERLYPGVKQMLEELRKSYKIGIIASQPKGLDDRIKALGIYDLLDAIFGSADIGLDKPDLAFYQYAIDKTGCDPKRAIMIGDRVDNDMFPAKTLGMSTIRVMQGIFSNGIATLKEQVPDEVIEKIADAPRAIAALEAR